MGHPVKPSSIIRLSGLDEAADDRLNKLRAGITDIIVSNKCFGVADGNELEFLLGLRMLGSAGKVLIELRTPQGNHQPKEFQDAIEAIAKLASDEFQHSAVEVQLDLGIAGMRAAKKAPFLNDQKIKAA